MSAVLAEAAAHCEGRKIEPAIPQILGAVSELDKAMTVAKLKGARDRVRRVRRECEGRKSYGNANGGKS
jgi:hypothetical protein